MNQYIMTQHPLTGDPMWYFRCGGDEAIELLMKFVKKWPCDYVGKNHRLYGHRKIIHRGKCELSVFNTLTGHIDIHTGVFSFDMFEKVVRHIYETEKSDLICWIGVNSVETEYVIGMPLTAGSIRGNYLVCDDGVLLDLAGVVDPTVNLQEEQWVDAAVRQWTEVLSDLPAAPECSWCKCWKTACERHGNCRECVAFHRDVKHNLPVCLRSNEVNEQQKAEG